MQAGEKLSLAEEMMISKYERDENGNLKIDEQTGQYKIDPNAAEKTAQKAANVTSFDLARANTQDLTSMLNTTKASLTQARGQLAEKRSQIDTLALEADNFATLKTDDGVALGNEWTTKAAKHMANAKIEKIPNYVEDDKIKTDESIASYMRRMQNKGGIPQLKALRARIS